MIPKVIHYCWFGGKPLPEDAKMYIESWKKYLPNYEIKEWNETNFDLNCCDYVKEAYQEKKWAFVSDYARLWIIYNYGGIYFDTDVELISSPEPIIENGAFLGCELNFEKELSGDTNQTELVNPGLSFGAEPKKEFYRELLNLYESQHFIDKNGDLNLETIVVKTTRLLKGHGFTGNDSIERVAGINIYSHEYFCPINYRTGRISVTEKTVSIHHYQESWLSALDKIINKIERSRSGVGTLEYKVRRIVSKPFRGVNRLKKKGILGFLKK